MNKIAGVLLGGISTFFFLVLASGEFQQPVFGLIPALGFGLTSMVLIFRGRRHHPVELMPVVADRIARLEETVATLQLELDTTQTSVSRLKEERVFLERLLAARGPTDQGVAHRLDL
jgi:hypothetical protein